MSEEVKDIVDVGASDVTEQPVDSTELVPVTPMDLNAESLALINQIIAETDDQKARDLTYLFNANQNKKTIVRVNKLSDLLDTITDQALVRFTSRPDEISNKELFDGLKIVQDLIERGQKQVSGAGETPLIQVNQQNNEVTIGGAPSNLSRDSRERVKSAVMGLLSSLTAATPEQTPVDAEIVDLVDTTEEDNNGE
jgi:hypothetical protein